ncbi:MAG: tRNA-(ms[2]io[6]A)-hydroxylase [Halioglobus sp.]|nr:tRNA-(ms[2]io[6]A)-hydroxylase [Halioglobus sp.]
MPQSPLRYTTPPAWTELVLADFDSFLLDHAAAEKKASGMAIAMLSHYPDRVELVAAMADLAVEELTHYREVVKWIHRRGLITAADRKDPYVLALRDCMRRGREVYLLDRLLTASIIEARGAERFALVANALQAGPLQRFYQSIARSEERHYTLFLQLAQHYLAREQIQQRWEELLDIEAAIAADLPLRAALH